MLKNMSPNVGLYWYVMMELPQPWKDLYRIIFIEHSYIYVVPMTWRWKSDPMRGWLLMCFIQSVLKTYPTINDLAVPLSLLPMYSTSFAYVRWHAFFLYYGFYGIIRYREI
jgi:phosphatidylinositol glycan class U